MVKYILITGGVLSGIGKGVIASSTGRLLKSYGFRVTQIKIDPYLNVDAGTMSPFEHGEVFVLDDGGEVDLDLGNYERFIDITLTSDNNITTGKIYKSVIEKERKGEYLGKTVQVIPHICNEIQDWVERVSHVPTDGTESPPDVCVIELGGTVGDIESMPFIEAMRQFQFRVGKENFCCIHVSLVPVVGYVSEQKTKPTQMSVRELRKLGLFPDIIACRSENDLTESTKNKISLFCHVPPENVIGVPDCGNLFFVPLLLHNQGYSKILLKSLNINMEMEPNLDEWMKIVNKVDELKLRTNTIKIAMVGKYTGLQDSYLSVIKSIEHASFFVDEKVEIEWIEASQLEDNYKSISLQDYEKSWQIIKSCQGILVPGGFGDRGVEGKILAAKYSRENKVPYFGICLGLQIGVIEYCRNVLQLEGANSEEFNEETPHRVVVFMPEIDKTKMGGTMRLGRRETHFSNKNSVIVKLYQSLLGVKDSVNERHRHRYEVNPDYVEKIQEHGLKFVGQDDTGKRQEIIELDDHPYYVGVQYHPEFKSRPQKPSPPFVGLILAASGKLQNYLTSLNQ